MPQHGRVEASQLMLLLRAVHEQRILVLSLRVQLVERAYEELLEAHPLLVLDLQLDDVE